MWACKSGHVDVVELLLRNGASPNKVAEVIFTIWLWLLQYPVYFFFLQNGFSSLIIASREGHYEVVKTLLAGKEKPDIDAFHQGVFA